MRQLGEGSATASRVEVLKALADPVRWSLLERLAHGPEVARKALHEEMALTETALTYHLRVLQAAGLVEVRKRGRCLYCMTSQETLTLLEEAVKALVPSGIPEGPTDPRR